MQCWTAAAMHVGHHNTEVLQCDKQSALRKGLCEVQQVWAFITAVISVVKTIHTHMYLRISGSR